VIINVDIKGLCIKWDGKYEESNLKIIIKLKEVKNYEDQKFIEK